ncbi:MAG: thermonuclease family protein [Patescibacteria group bacterium]|jgi:micrococcal nuclease
MSKSQQQKLLGAIFSIVVIALGVWQASTTPPQFSTLDEEVSKADYRNVPEGYTVLSRVVDGDTIEVAFSDTDKYKVRLIGINTPESVDPRKPVECFGHEATEHLKALLNVSSVRLSTDPSQASEDKYDRWLRYVYTADGTDINLQMIKDGYAHEYTYNTPYVNQKVYRAAEAEAKTKKIGLWSPDTCNGNP